ncbi:hypothetical protein PPROV_000559400 [Pycnococcus provasolii]|uniref:PARP-type domain-containing protein n=1 Tax=Pycnococcus provasolii TaxID=41880 RepID=A0A830HM25_9CHLO|nr:hypothetical protein PPROV_000559400 [Pycnococcus provasolii]|mmetsp:Transcript_11242/g.25320  ORF Transcript_11242/g.25320 Transcript_11242/m.25320 type:complete len:205 (-) Transcript_11242:967-1581(-)
MPSYVLEYAKSNRSTCSACKQHIAADELRFGSKFHLGGDKDGPVGVSYKHIKCITAKIWRNIDQAAGELVASEEAADYTEALTMLVSSIEERSGDELAVFMASKDAALAKEAEKAAAKEREKAEKAAAKEREKAERAAAKAATKAAKEAERASKKNQKNNNAAPPPPPVAASIPPLPSTPKKKRAEHRAAGPDTPPPKKQRSMA